MTPRNGEPLAIAVFIIANGSATGNIARSRAVKRLAAVLLAAAVAPAASAAKPRLVLTITVDQFRYDYLTRFDAKYKGGLRRLLDKGAVFTSARYDHFPTVTAVGHSTVATGTRWWRGSRRGRSKPNRWAAARSRICSR
jgi:hypothetical protein